MLTANVAASDVFLGKAFLLLEEIAANGAAVQSIPIKNLLWSLDMVNSVLGTGGLKFARFLGLGTQPNFNVAVNFVVTDAIGVLNVVGNPVVTPKSMETIIEINNFPYINTGNSIRLTIVVASEAANVTATANFLYLTHGNGTGKGYSAFGKVALTDNVVQGVNVVAIDGTLNDIVDTPNIQAQIQARYNVAAAVKKIQVTFPAGAKAIVYDPAIGVGDAPIGATPVTSAGSLIAPSLFLLVAFILALFF